METFRMVAEVWGYCAMTATLWVAAVYVQQWRFSRRAADPTDQVGA